MIRAMAVLAVVAMLVGCGRSNRNGGNAERDTTMVGADTSVNRRTVKDTTVVRHDTTVRVDTVRNDSAKRARPRKP
jgi:hypothetical protein